jgi:integrase
MAHVWKRTLEDGSTRYTVRIRLKGHPALTETFERKTDAKRWAERMQSEIRKGQRIPTNEARKRTLAELVEAYLADETTRKLRGRAKLASMLGRWVDELGELYLAAVTKAKVAEVRNIMLKEKTYRGTLRSPATVNRYLQALGQAFNHGIRELEWIQENPVEKVKRGKEPAGRVRFLSDEEREALIEACKASPEERLYPLALLALATGARRGELLRLRWRDLDLARGAAVLHHTKNGEPRGVPVSGAALEFLRERSKLRRLDTDRIFAAVNGRAYFPQSAWDKAVTAAELVDFTFHDLRHTAASYLAMSGATVSELAAILGHKSLSMVRRYTHMTASHTSGVVARMTERFLDA